MPENDLQLPSRSYWDGFKARNAALLDKIAYSGNNFTEFIGLAPMIRYITGDPNTTSTEALVAPVAGTANVVSKGAQKVAPVVKEVAEQAVEQVVKRRGRPPKAVETQLKPRVQKAADEIEAMVKDKVDRIKTAYSNKKYRASDNKIKGIDTDKQRAGYNTQGKDNLSEGKDFYGNPIGTSYHNIENYQLKYRWNPKKGAQGNFNDLKKFIAQNHPDIEYYHDESVWKYLMKNFPQEMKAAGYDFQFRLGGKINYLNYFGYGK